MSATFHLEDPGGDLASALPELAVGPWRYAPAGLVAFDAGGPATPRWRVDLVRDGAASHQALASGERSVARSHALLDDVPRRLADALDRALDDRSLAAGPPTRESPTWGRLASFADLGAPRAPVRTAEARLIAALTGGIAPLELDQLAWSAEPSAAPAEPEPGRLAQLLDRVADLARGRSRIETRVEGALVAQSLTTLTGDTELWIAPRLSLTGARLHARSVAVAVRTRHAWARVLTLTVRGAGRLALLGLPGGALSAVPLVWRFVRDVLRELRRRDAALRPAV
ncbi:MAG TPA: hypothetical protein VHT91_41345 [Kofleriaceae bacterium]|nr:hypothetical protein [Kofleriaceae bacterium]